MKPGSKTGLSFIQEGPEGGPGTSILMSRGCQKTPEIWKAFAEDRVTERVKGSRARGMEEPEKERTVDRDHEPSIKDDLEKSL